MPCSAMAELCNNVWLEASNARWSLTWARATELQQPTLGVSLCYRRKEPVRLTQTRGSREPRTAVAVAAAELKQGLSVLSAFAGFLIKLLCAMDSQSALVKGT
eukprot:4439358-Amphidinium_carterae.1